MKRLVRADIVAPVVKEGLMPDGVGGYYNHARRAIFLPLSRMDDEKDFWLVLAHEMAHYFQSSLNPGIDSILRNRVRLNGTQRKNLLMFTEGFAQYAAVKAGGDKRLLRLYHELNAPEYYWKGREFFEKLELLRGESGAVAVALSENPLNYDVLNQRLSYEIQGSPIYQELVKLLERNRVWRRYYLFWKGLPPGFRKEMERYVVSRRDEILKEELKGWGFGLVIKEATLLAIADFIISKCSVEKPHREWMKWALETLFMNRYQKWFWREKRAPHSAGLPWDGILSPSDS